MELPNPNQVDPRRAKDTSTIQYGYRKSETNARVFSEALAHGNSKNEIR